jgi:polar amino acid transport system permease protein
MAELWASISTYMPVLMLGVEGTLIVTAGSLALSTVLGLVWALMRASGIKWVAMLSEWIINILRGIPIIVILFYIYFVLPDLGFSLTATQAGIIGLGVAYSAYQSENFRAGIEAVGHGQVEAALSMGMSWPTAMRRVILPQAFRITLPPYGNTMIMMLKDSSQASTITVAELAMQGKLLALSTFDNKTVFTLVALIYLVMCLPLILIVKHLEKRGGKR